MLVEILCGGYGCRTKTGMPGVIEPRAVSAHACAAGAVSTTRMKTTIALPGTIHAKAVSAQALASGRPAQTYETVTIKLGGKSL